MEKRRFFINNYKYKISDVFPEIFGYENCSTPLKKRGIMKKSCQNIFVLPLLILLLNSVNGQEGEWNTISEMPFPVAGGRAIVADSLILVIGGAFITNAQVGGDISDLIQVYDPHHNTWDIIEGAMLKSRAGFVAGIYDNALYSCGGVWDFSGDPFAFGLERWNFVADPAFLNFNLEFNRVNTTGLVHENKLYLIGGLPAGPDSLQLSYIVEYDLSLSAITYADGGLFDGLFLPFQQMSARIGNDIYIFGGVRFGISREVYKFNMIDHTLEVMPPLNREIAGGAAVSINDEEIYLIGGFNESPIEPALDSVLIYNVSSPDNNVQMGPQLNFNRWDLMAARFENAIYAFGGVDVLGNALNSVEMLDNVTAISPTESAVIETFALFPNFPNPFNPVTTIAYQVKQSSLLRLDIYSALGQHITTLVERKHAPGRFEVTWNGRDKNGIPVSSGVYYYRLNNRQFTLSRKMVLLR